MIRYDPTLVDLTSNFFFFWVYKRKSLFTVFSPLSALGTSIEKKENGGHLLGTFFFIKVKPLRQTWTLKQQPVCTPIIDSTAIVKYLTRLLIEWLVALCHIDREWIEITCHI